MATPITWRNVNGPSLAEASRPLDTAANTLNGSFDIFNRLLKQREATDAANTLQLQENQKNAYLDQLATAKTPEQLAAQGDQLAQMKAALSPAARASVRSADETRLDTLYKQTKTANEFKDYSLDRAQLPVTQNILSLASQGKKSDALALMQQNPDIRMPAPLMDAIVKGDRDFTKFGWDQQNQTWKGETHALDMKVGKSNLETAKAQRGLIGAQTTAAGIQNQIGQINLNDLKDQRQAEGVIGQLGAAYQKATDESKAKIGSAALEYSRTNEAIPMNRDGSIDTTRMTSDQTKKFDAYLKDQGLPDTSIYTRGDTQEAAAVKSYLVKQGMRPALIDKLTPQIASSFNTAPIDKIGNDAYSRDQRSAMNDVVEKNLAERFGSVSTPADLKPLLDAADTALKSTFRTKTFGVATSADDAALKLGVAKYLQEGGIKGSKDDPTRILPSPETLRILIQQLPEKTGKFANGTDVYNALKEWDNTNAESASKLFKQRGNRRIEDVIDPPKKGK